MDSGLIFGIFTGVLLTIITQKVIQMVKKKPVNQNTGSGGSGGGDVNKKREL